MKPYVDHVLIAGALALVTIGYVVLEAIGHGPQPRLLDAVIALAGVIGGFAMRRTG